MSKAEVNKAWLDFQVRLLNVFPKQTDHANRYSNCSICKFYNSHNLLGFSLTQLINITIY